MLSRSVILFLCLLAGYKASSGGDKDEQICRQKFSLAIAESLGSKPIGEVIAAVGRSFEGTPYAAHTLEQEGDERLVINLQGLDCVTFVENALTLSRCIKKDSTSFASYANELQRTRYRGGVIDGYPSRLHYFSDWIHDNQVKGIAQDVSLKLGGEVYPKKIDFMTRHADAYPRLRDAGIVQQIKSTESAIATRTMYYVPKNRVQDVQSKIMNGDIIGITTTVEGLDISHTGIAVRVDGVLKFLHAPLSNGVVQITNESLADYLVKIRKNTGIIIARPLEPDISH